MTARRLRVLHATPAFAPAYRFGGPVRSIEGLVVELHRRGVDVRVVATNANGPGLLATPRGWTTWRDVPVHYLRRWAAPDLAPAFAWESYVEARRADVVHVLGLFSAPSMAAVAAAQAARVPVVLSPRGVLEPAALALASASKKRAWLRAFGPLLRRLHMLHATSDAEARSIAAVLGTDVRIAVVPNGTDLEPADAARARKLRAPPSARIGALGRLHPIKQLDRLLAAAALLLGRGVSLEVVLAGSVVDPAHAELLHRLASAPPLVGHVRFEGELSGEAKLDFLASSSVLCLCSASENFGNVVVEAMASFTPVVAARGTPWSELEAAGAGRWVDATPEALADAIEPFLRDASLARAAGERGRALVEARYGWPRVAARMEEVYRALVP